ncbi:MAG: hypothetical protein L0387_24150 [Acidobacteria bacterium]|nr:hypothetical protein [Acidobacteriota bacterium]
MNAKSKHGLVAIVVVSLLLILATVITLLHTPPVRRYALDEVREYLRARHGIEFEAAHLEYDLLGLFITLKQVTLKSSAAPDLPPFLKINRIYVKLPLRHLLSGLIALHDASWEGLALHVVLDEAGRNNLPKRPPQPEPVEEMSEQEPSYLISSLKVTGGSAVSEDRPHNLQIRLPRWSLGIQGVLETFDHHIRFQTEEAGAAIYQERLLALQNLEFEAALKRDRLEVKNFQLDSSGSQVMLSGGLEDFSKPVVNVSADVDLGLRPIAQFAALEEKIEGRVKAQAAVNVSENQIQISSQFEGSDIAVAEFEQIDVTANANWDSNSQTVNIGSFSLHSPLGSAQGQAKLNLFRERGRSWLNARVEALDLQRISLKLDFPIQIASRAQGTLWTSASNSIASLTRVVAGSSSALDRHSDCGSV